MEAFYKSVLEQDEAAVVFIAVILCNEDNDLRRFFREGRRRTDI